MRKSFYLAMISVLIAMRMLVYFGLFLDVVISFLISIQHGRQQIIHQ